MCGCQQLFHAAEFDTVLCRGLRLRHQFRCIGRRQADSNRITNRVLYLLHDIKQRRRLTVRLVEKFNAVDMSAQREGQFIQQNFIAACICSALCNVAQIGHNVRIGRIQPVFTVVVTPSAAILILHRQVGILFGCRLVLEAIYASDNMHAVFAQLAHVLCEFFRLLCLQVLHVRYHIGLYRNV